METTTVRFEVRMWRKPYTTGNCFDGDNPIQHPAEYAIYAHGVRMAYAGDEDSANKKAARWNDGNVPDAIERKAESAEFLRQLLNPGDTVYTILRHRSRSGMMRHISCVFNMEDITWHVANVLGDKRADDGGIKVGGCGMDMGFSLVYNLSSALFPDGFECSGRTEEHRCPSNDHSNGDRNYEPHHHGSGGYALKQRWL